MAQILQNPGHLKHRQETHLLTGFIVGGEPCTLHEAGYAILKNLVKRILIFFRNFSGFFLFVLFLFLGFFSFA